jgi:hypothetical protein
MDSQAYGRVLEDCAHFQGELLLAMLLEALEKTGVREILDVIRAAPGTSYPTICPAETDHERMAVGVIAEEPYCFKQCFRGAGGFHTSSIHFGIGFSGGFLGFYGIF